MLVQRFFRQTACSLCCGRVRNEDIFVAAVITVDDRRHDTHRCAVADYDDIAVTVGFDKTAVRLGAVAREIALGDQFFAWTRLKAVEAILRGGTADAATLAKAGDAAVAEVEIESDSRGSADYKKHLLRVHLARAVQHIVGA